MELWWQLWHQDPQVFVISNITSIEGSIFYTLFVSFVFAGCASAVGLKSSGSGSSVNCGNSPEDAKTNKQIDPGFMFHLQELKDFLMSEKSK